MKATHLKRVFRSASLSALLREVADFCEGFPVDGPIVVDFDSHIMAHRATVFYLPFASEIDGSVVVVSAPLEISYKDAELVS